MSADNVDDTSKNSNSRDDEIRSKRRRLIFGDCALIEIIHLHDCLRGALKALEKDVKELADPLNHRSECKQHVTELERRVAGRFKVIWSVFRAHSSAEDEFIWPALQAKTQGRITGSHKYKSGEAWEPGSATESKMIEKEEYEEDHADEERMFSEMDRLLTEFREYLLQKALGGASALATVDNMTRAISDHTKALSQHLMTHLDKEETECMPLVAKHLSKSEIDDLVGQIMGRRSADTIAQIMKMAVQNLDDADRLEMVKYMKQAMSGTFFDRWLLMSGWMSSKGEDGKDKSDEDRKRSSVPAPDSGDDGRTKRVKREDEDYLDQTAPIVTSSPRAGRAEDEITTQSELEKFIRAIASNPALTAQQKNGTIQSLRDSVWKSNQRQRTAKSQDELPTVVNANVHVPQTFLVPGEAAASGFSSIAGSRARRVTPPSMYYKKNALGKVEVVRSSESPSSASFAMDDSVPLFSATELAPTFHDGAAGAVLGCPHYARACKLRHPKSGRLYTCRVCCEQERELPMKDKDVPLDRYAVSEVMCMKCHSLQPAEDRCIYSDCESRGKPFAKYFCRICHLYDDEANKNIFHCPYCNCCRLGLGLGIDFRHCMVRCFYSIAGILGDRKMTNPALAISEVQCLCFSF
jgi:hypothetical protein